MTDLKKKAGKSLERITEIVMGATPVNDSLFGGELTAAYYLYYLYEATGNEDYAEAALDRVEKVLHGFNNGNAKLSGPYFCSGAGGLFYLLVLFIKKGLVGADMNTELKELGQDLLEYALAAVENDYNDFVHGSFGLLHCFNHYAACFGDDSFLQSFLRKIEIKYLLSGNPWIVSAIGNEDEKKMVNLSLSHGQAGFLIILMKAYTLGSITENIKERLLGNARYLAGFNGKLLSDTHCSFFPSFVNPATNELTANNRLAWCYGDLGQVLFLTKAATFFNDESFGAAANAICKASTSRTSFAATLIEDAHFCHGMGGVSHFYKVLGELSGEQYCAAASSYWMEQALDIIDRDIEASIKSTGRLNMIEGLPGVGLTLMSYISEQKLDWGNLILLE
jgi:lantibiotic biosynthesis protein